jgi:GTP-binding protein
MPRPIVALVGRPNVGKSTLFNRLAGERLAVVDERPGTTRDRLVAEAEWRGRTFNIVDTGGIDPAALSSASPLSLDSVDYIDPIRRQAELASEAADAVLLIVDGESGPTAADHEIAETLRRRSGRHDQKAPLILLVVNKCDNESRRQGATEFYELGMGEPHPISAFHGIGIGDLLDDLLQILGTAVPATETQDDELHLAIIGRPNVGKSSLLNRLLGEERVIVSPIPGTTRDAIDTHLTYHGLPITLIDTAGIRRRGRIEPGVEKYSVLRALRAIDRSDVTLLLVDAGEGITAQDAHIAGLVLDKAKSIVVLVNKWDTAPPGSEAKEAFARLVRQELNFLDYVPVLFISAKTGKGVGKVLPTALRVQEERLRRISTADLNRLLRRAFQLHPPPTRAGRQLKITYAAQVRTDPPTFLFHVNDPQLVHFSYRRFLENQIRQAYGFLGTPLRLSFRRRSKDRKP